MQTVTLAGHTITLAAPGTLAACWDVLASHQQNPRRALAAALGLCWREGSREGSRKSWTLKSTLRPDYNVGRYGGDVTDELLAAGVSFGELMAAGGQALALIVAALPSETEVQAEADFLSSGVGST